MNTKTILIFLSFSICIRVDGKPLFNSLTFSASGRSENQGVYIVRKGPLKEKVLILCQPKNGCSLANPANTVRSALSNQESTIKQIQTKEKMSKLNPRKPIWLIANLKQGNQIFRKIKESRKKLTNEKNESPTLVVSELRRNQTSVKLIKSCHFDKVKKCTNSEWFKFWNSGMADSNSITQSAGSNKTPMTEKESPNQENQANTKDQKATVKICNFEKFEKCTRKEWHEFLKGNGGLTWQLSKSQLI